MRNIKQIKNLKGKRVLLRVDFNVSIKDGVVQDDFRIKKALPTIKYLKQKGARIILVTHFGKGGDTLLPIANALKKLIKSSFVANILGGEAEQAVTNMKDGDIILLENLRNDKGEQSCDRFFASSLAKFGDVYVNDSFSVDHRSDASIVLLPKLLPHYAGFQLEEEIENLSRAFKKPKHPFLFILGGAKFSTKMPLIEKYLKLADHVFIGGALLNDFLKAKGYEIGKSLASENNFGIEKMLENKKIILPEDVLVKSGDIFINKKVSDIEPQDFIIDIGEQAVKNIAPFVKKSKLVLWNGPLGKYEDGGDRSTKQILKLVASSKALSIVGGGDTVSLISEMKIEKKFSFVSTGGGATLDFLANGTLPGIKALQ
ncbi:MAG: phosphoglycerate kinase [Candidatus Pacebacteria bacterium]|nr:phosphoglycerate kinase [Candidatus Paceibacterota bacterium]